MDPDKLGLLERIQNALRSTKETALDAFDPRRGRGLFGFGADVLRDIQTNPLEALTVKGDIEAHQTGRELSAGGHPVIGAALQALAAGGLAATTTPILGNVANVAQRHATRAARSLLPEAAAKANREIIESTVARGGATFTPDGRDLSGQALTSVARRPGDDKVVDELTPDVLDAFREEFSDDLAQEGAAIGTWVRDDGKTVLDVVEAIPDRAEAIQRGRTRGQDGVFDLEAGEFIPTPAASTGGEIISGQPSTVRLFHSRDPSRPIPADEPLFLGTQRTDVIEEQGGAPAREFEVNMENPLVIDTDDFGNISTGQETERSARARLIEQARANGHDAIVIRGSRAVGEGDEVILTRGDLASEVDEDIGGDLPFLDGTERFANYTEQLPTPDELFGAGTQTVDEYLDFAAGGGRRLPTRPATAAAAAKARLKFDNRNQANRAARREAIESGLTEQERAVLSGGRRDSQKAVEEAYSMLPTPEAFAQAAIRGAESRGWYEGSGQAIRESFGDEAPRFTALLAAMSPQKSVEENLRIALRTWGDWNAAGRPTDEAGLRAAINSTLEADVGNSMRALRAEAADLATGDPALLNGPKVGPFYANLVGQVDPVVNDTHMARGYGTLPTSVGTKARTLAQNAMVRNAAKEFERITGRAVDARELQEMSWAYIRGLTNAAGDEGKALETIEQAFLEPGAKFAGGQEISDRIRNSVSIGHLMADPAFAEDLARAGVQVPAPRSPSGTPGVDPQSADINALRDIAERIDLVRAGKPLYSAAPVGLFGIANAKQRFERDRQR